MQQVYTGILVFLGLILMSSTCERPAIIDLGEPEPKLVISSEFTVGASFKVIVTKTQSVFDEEEVTYIEDAVVEVFKDESFIDTLHFVPSVRKSIAPFYVSDNFAPSQGEEFMLRVSAPGFETIEAKSYIPFKVNITSLKVCDVEELITQGESFDRIYKYKVKLQFLDPADEMNYYQLDFFQDIVSYSLDENGDTLKDNVERRQISFSPTEDRNFFIALYAGGVLFEDQEFNGAGIEYEFVSQVEINSEDQYLDQLVAQLRTVSEEYYKYYNSVSRQITNSNDPFSQPVFVDSNILNGKGVFAGYSQSVDSTFVNR